MKKIKIDSETKEMIKFGLIDCGIEIVKDILIFSLGVITALSLVSDTVSEE